MLARLPLGVLALVISASDFPATGRVGDDQGLAYALQGLARVDLPAVYATAAREIELVAVLNDPHGPAAGTRRRRALSRAWRGIWPTQARRDRCTVLAQRVHRIVQAGTYQVTTPAGLLELTWTYHYACPLTGQTFKHPTHADALTGQITHEQTCPVRGHPSWTRHAATFHPTDRPAEPAPFVPTQPCPAPV